jgi:hypothetical protein
LKINSIRVSIKSALCLMFLISIAAGSSSMAFSQKMKPEEVVAKHLESVGTAEQRAATKNRIALGTVVVSFRSPNTGTAPGRFVMASEGEKHLIGMMFDGVPNYPQEKVGYDGKNVTVSYVRPGKRSTLGDLLEQYKSVVSQGVLGGSLSSAWPLYNLEGSKAKLEYGGMKKAGDKQAHVLKYIKGGTDMEVSFYFDAETFQHLRTEYTRTIAAQIGGVSAAGQSPTQRDSNINSSARQRESRYRIVEEFGDFKKEGELTLPHKYKILVEVTLPGGSYKADWEATLAQFGFNQEIDPKSFDVEGN